jgi:uncharacterized protein YjbI with pentapeptide repeats
LELINSTPFQFGNIVGRINFPNDSLTLIVKATLDLKPNQPAQPSGDQAFPTGDEFAPQDQEQTGSLQYASDFAFFKPGTDLLLKGKCHAPNGQAVSQCDVVFQVGEARRLLRVFGNRYWEHTVGGGSISEPTKFVEMPISYEFAFGGEGFKQNPVGIGIAKGKLLPNIEDPNHLIASPGDTPAPAGYGPLHPMWEQRYAKLGTYKGDYLIKRWPWFPDDFHWTHFNAAPAELQMDGYLRGDESLIFENLHAVHAKYESQLPGIRIRCFTRVMDPKTNKHIFEEVSMNLDTLWVNMEEEKLVLLWRGWTEVATDEFEEIEHIFIMSEALDQKPATVDQAHTLFKQKLAELEKEWGLTPEIPKKVIEETKDEFVHEATKSAAETTLKKVIAEEVEEPLIDAKALESQVNKMLAQLGIDVESLPAEAQQQMQQQQAKLLARLTETNPEKLAEAGSQELQAQLKAELAKVDIDIDNLPPVSEKAAQEQQRFMQELGFDEEALVGSDELKQLWEITSTLLPKMGLDPENLTPLIEHAKLQQGKMNIPLGIGTEGKEIPLETTAEAELKAKKITEIKSRAEKGETFVGEDFTGLDLSDMDLKGLDFTGATLIGANLQNSDLTGAVLNEAKLINANLTNAKLNQAHLSAADCTNADLSCVECVATNLSASVFVNAKIIGADLSECDLSLANLSGSDLSGTKFENADMTLANASKAQLDNANLFGADLSDAIFEGAQITGAKLDQITAKDAIFSGANVSNSRFVEAKLSGADFSAGVLNDANFQGADLSEASLEKVTAKNINLSHANLEKMGASEASDFSGANLEQAQGKESIWHEANLNDANFAFSKMEGADFTKASLHNVQGYGADMRFARFRKADLSSAQMLDMNLFKGSLEKANLTGAIFNGSNLYGVEFLEAHLEKTQLGNANVKATKLQEAV